MTYLRRNPRVGLWLTMFLLQGLVASTVLASPKKQKRNRTQVFAVGLADDLAHKAGRITQWLRKVMLETPRIQVLDLTSKLQAAPTGKNKQFMEKARKSMIAAKKALREMEYEEGVRQANKARRAFEKMGGQLSPLKRYKESILLLAVGNAMQGNKKAAQKAFLDLLLLDRHLKLNKTAYEGFVLEIFIEVKKRLGSQPLGSLAIKTTPSGGNLYLDGKLKGVTPDSMDGLTAGNHLVMVKMPGYENWGKVVKVDAGNLVSLDIQLTPGKAGSGFTQIVERAGKAVSDSDLRGEVLRLGQTLGLDWVWLCQLKHKPYEIELVSYLFEFSQSRILYKDTLTMELNDYGLEEEVRNFGRKFMREGLRALKKFREEGDPLSGHSGTEDWHSNESESARINRDTHGELENNKKTRTNESGDPLDDRDGTEDW